MRVFVLDKNLKPLDPCHPARVRRIRKLCPITAISQELVRFDLQQIQNPEIRGIEYQRGELFGFEVKEYLLAKWGRKCAYCGVENVPFEIEHILAKSKGGSNRVSNLCISCHPCNQSKGNKPVEDFLKKKPEVKARVLAQAKAPLKDAAAIRFKPSFKLTTGGKSFDVHPKYLKTIHRADGYEYSS